MEKNTKQITEKLNGAEETKRQFLFMEKAKEYVASLEQELGRKPTCCVTTFGCQMNARDSEKLVGVLEQIGYQEPQQSPDGTGEPVPRRGAAH